MAHHANTSVFAAIGLAAVMAAQIASGAVYYVSPDGTGTGASWDDPAGFEAAYAAAGEAGGGELWLKKGFHVLKDTVILKSGVVVRGGFAGSETSADQADPVENITSISGDTDHDNKWRPDGGFTERLFVSIYDDNGGYVDINPTGANRYWSPGDSNATYTKYAVNDIPVGFENTADAAVSIVAFHGIWFSGFKNSVFKLTTGTVAGMVLEDCAFIANNTVDSSFVPLYLSAAIVQVKGSRFVGNRRCVYLGGGEASFTDCIFEDNALSSGYTSASWNAHVAVNATNAKMVLSGCTFRRNHSMNNQSYGTSDGVYVAAGKVYATNTCFTANRSYNSATAGNSRGLIWIGGSNAKFYAYGCRITDNLMISSSQTGSAVFNSGSGDFVFEDCYIARNVVTNNNATAGAYSTSVFVNDGQSSQFGSGYFINCTIEQNKAVANKAGSVGTFYTKCDYGRQFAFVNCTIADNEVLKSADSTAKYAAEYINEQTTTTPIHSFFNTICRGKGAAGHPFAALNASAALPDAFINSSIYGYPGQVLSTANPTYSWNVPTNDEGYVTIPMTDAKLSEKLAKGVFDVPQRGVTPDSPLRKSGVDYWKGNDGNWWYYDSHLVPIVGQADPRVRTVNAANYGGTLAQRGIDSSKDNPYPDAAGAARRLNKVCLGPLNPVPGMCVLVK